MYLSSEKRKWNKSFGVKQVRTLTLNDAHKGVTLISVTHKEKKSLLS